MTKNSLKIVCAMWIARTGTTDSSEIDMQITFDRAPADDLPDASGSAELS